MKKPRVLLDVDGVVADFISPALEVIERVSGAPPHPECTNDWDLFRHYDRKTQNLFYAEFKKPGWCASLKPYPEAVVGVQMLRDTGADVYFVTAPMNGPHWAHERTEWLIKHFGASWKHVVSTHAKYLCVGDVFVDDKIDHVVSWLDHHPGKVGLLWAQPYNAFPNNLRRAHTWQEVVSAVQDARSWR